MKICVIGTRGFPDIEGGVEKHCESLYKALGDNNSIIVYRRKAYVKSREPFSGIKFVDLPSTKIKGLEAIIHSFLATIHTIKIRPDVVHIHNIGPGLFSFVFKWFSIPVVLTYHSANYEHNKWGKFAKWVLRLSEKVALKNADRIIFVNKYQMRRYSKWIQRKSVYIPNGINTMVHTDHRDYLEQINVQKGKYILSVGRITPEKGFDTLIKGFYEMPGHKDYKLVIAGGVEFENGYMEMLRELCKDNRVIFTGAVYGEKLAQLYTNAALFVLASNNEGFPLVLLEAMSYGLDVLVSDIPATHLVKLKPDDYFQKGDNEQLSNTMERKLNSAIKRKYDLKNFDWNDIGQHVERIYFQAKIKSKK